MSHISQSTRSTAHPAVVTRTPAIENRTQRYLLLDPAGHRDWVTDPHAATPFESMREVTRMAFRLPASDRAFGMPLERVHFPTAGHC